MITVSLVPPSRQRGAGSILEAVGPLVESFRKGQTQRNGWHMISMSMIGELQGYKDKPMRNAVAGKKIQLRMHVAEEWSARNTTCINVLLCEAGRFQSIATTTPTGLCRALIGRLKIRNRSID